MNKIRIFTILMAVLCSLGLVASMLTSLASAQQASAQQSPGQQPPEGKADDQTEGTGAGCSPLYGGGRDLYFGYTIKDSLDPGGPSYEWIEISSSGTPVLLGDDDYDGPFPIGFTFNLYGDDHTHFYIGSNGFLSFGGGSTDLGNDCPLPSTVTPNNIIALMWDDLDPGDTGAPVYYQSFAAGACPYGGYAGACLVVQYEDFCHFPGGGACNIAGTFEAILFENNDILIQYEDAGDEIGSGSTTGIENAYGSDGLTYACNTEGSLSAGLAIQFYYPDPAPDFTRSSKQATTKVELGDPIFYTLDILNTGTLVASSVVMTDILPTGVTYISGSLSCNLGTCWYDEDDNAVYWSGEIAAATTKGEIPTPGVLLTPSGGNREAQPPRDSAEDNLPNMIMPSTAQPGTILETFPNIWDADARGLVYDPSRDNVRYAHQVFVTADIYDVEYPVPHSVDGSLLLSVVNPTWPASLDLRNGIGYDATTDTYFLPDYNGDLVVADDNIVEIDATGAILNAWEVDGAGNDSYDGSAINQILDIAIVPGTPTRYFAVAGGDGSMVYEIELIKTGAWWTPDTWGTLNTCAVPGLGENGGIDYDAEHGLLYHSDRNSTNIVITDLDCNVLESFTCDSPAGYNLGVTYIEGKAEPEIWVTDGNNSTTRCAPPSPCEPVTLLFEDFEDGLGGWSATGLWNLEQESDTCGSAVAPFPTSDWDAYYGRDDVCNYDTGVATDGALTLAYNVDLTRVSGASLSFWSYEETECGGGNCGWDNRYVDVSTDGGASWATVWASTGPDSAWYQASADLSAYIGGVLQVRFRFDSVDSTANNFFGWMVDNVEIVGCMPSARVIFGVEAPAWCGPVVNQAIIDDPGAEPVTVQATTEVVEELYQRWDFEVDDGGFVPGPTSEWEWGVPAYPPGLSAHSGEKVWGTDLHGDADDTVGTHHLTRTVTLPSHPNGVYLQWWDWNGAESSDCIEVYVDGTQVFQRCDHNQRHWESHAVDVSAWAGQTVDVEFVLSVCCSNPGPDGWYIDDVAIHSGCISDIALNAPPLEAAVCVESAETLELSICNNDNLPLWWYMRETSDTAHLAVSTLDPTKSTALAGSLSVTAPEGYIPSFTRSWSPDAHLLGGTVAIFKDLDPWGTTDVEAFLAANSIPYEVHTSAEFGSLDFNNYGMIVFSSDQPQAFYDAYAGYVDKFEEYVEGGGFLNFFSADDGWNGGLLTALLPGGMTWSGIYEYYNLIDDPLHPVVQGVPNTFYGSFASHGHFENLPAGAHIIAHEQIGGLPTIVEYALGSGWFIAFGQPLEYSHSHAQDAGVIMENTLLWGGFNEVPWLSENPVEGSVITGTCETVEVTMDATGLAPGDYTAGLFLLSNDPDTPMITLPVTMTAITPADLALTKADDPDPVYIGDTLTYILVVTNNGPCATINDGVLTDTLPVGVTFVNASHPGCSENGGVVTCNLGDIPSGEAITVSITVIAPDTPGTITNVAEVGSATEDPDPTNNTASEDTLVSLYEIYLPIAKRE